jgi:hypothetical protein
MLLCINGCLLPASRPAGRESKYLLSKISNPLQPAQAEGVLGHQSMCKVSWGGATSQP